MAVIRLGEPRALAPARRINLGLGGLVVLQRALAGADGPRLPSDFEVEPTVLALAGPDLERLIEETAQTLRGHRVIDDDGPVDAVLANLAAVTGSPHRVRMSLSGQGASVVALYWTSAEVAGSLVREGAHCTLSLFDARAFGSEILTLTLMPEPEHPADDREVVSAPLEALAVLSTLDELAEEQVEPMGSLLEVDPDLARVLRSWSESVLAVLHVTVYDVDPARLPGMAVWFLDRAGWWSARTWRDGETRMVEIEPRDRTEGVSDGLCKGSVTATAGAVSATVTATTGGLSITSPAGTVQCSPDQAVTSYGPGISEAAACTITFTRASRGYPDGFPLAASTEWEASWTASTGDSGDLDGRDVSETTYVPVVESQSLVNSVR